MWQPMACSNILNIAPRRLGQLLPAARAGDVALPAVHILDDGLRVLLQDGERKLIRLLTAELIVGAQGDLLHIAQHVELRQGDVRRALHLHAVARGDKVDRPDAARAAVLAPYSSPRLSQLLGLLAEPLAHERPLADAGGIRLHHTDHLVDLRRRQAEPTGAYAAMEFEEVV